MVFSVFIPGNLISMANLLAAVPNDKQVSFYKDASGNMQSQTVEFSTVTQNTGYAFQYPDGSVIYTVPPIASYLAIPWANVLTGVLYDTANIVLWLDASEVKSINVTLQKWISKYTNFMTIENTPTYAFTNPTNTIDLSAQGAIESYDALTIKQYFKFGIVFSITNLILTNNTIFQHDRVSIRLTQQTSPDTTLNYMIGLYDNGVFKKGVALSATVDFKYFVYCDNTATLIVSGNTSVMSTGSTAFNTSGSAKVYIGQQSNGANNSYIKVYELLYYTSTINNLAMTNVDLYAYFSTKWSLSTYTDTYNILPWTNPYDEFLVTGSLRLFTGDYGNTDGVSWYTFNGVQNSGDTNRLSGQCGVNNNQNGCLKCISLANTQYVSGFSSITTITPFTVVVLVRFTVNGGFTMLKFGSSTLWLIDVLATSGNMRINPTQGFYCDYNTGMALNTWYIMTYKYSGGLLSTAL